MPSYYRKVTDPSRIEPRSVDGRCPGQRIHVHTHPWRSETIPPISAKVFKAGPLFRFEATAFSEFG